jgi:hypothetical protein
MDALSSKYRLSIRERAPQNFEDDAHFFRILMSTKNLLGSALQTSHLEFFSTFYRRLLNVC